MANYADEFLDEKHRERIREELRREQERRIPGSTTPKVRDLLQEYNIEQKAPKKDPLRIK